MRLDGVAVQPHHLSVLHGIRTAILAATFSMCLPTSLAAQHSAETPRQVAERILAAEAAGDWRRVIALSDPRSVEWFKRWNLALSRIDPSSDGGGMLLYLFSVRTAAELEALPADSVLARYLRAVHPRRDQDVDPRPRREILGAIAEGDTAAHIVYRTRIQAPARAPSDPPAMEDIAVTEWLDIVSLRRTPAGWRAWVTSSLLNGSSRSMVVRGQSKAAGRDSVHR